MENDSFFGNNIYQTNYNIAAFAISFGILLTFILLISLPDALPDRKTRINLGYSLAAYSFIVVIIYLTGYTIYNKEGENNIIKYMFTALFGLTFELIRLFSNLVLGSKGNLSGNSTNPAMTLDSLGNRYGGGMTQIKNLGKGDSGSLILNYFRVSKRGSILPCDSKTGTCKVRRSTVYMIIYLAFIVLTPIFITLGNIANDGFDISTMLGYLNLFLAITFGIVVVFVLGTIKSAAGSDVFNVASTTI